MVNFPDAEGGHDSNFPVHVRNYLGFMNLVKWTIVVVAIIAAVVIYVIAN
ncbi:aa3-type cytochrome c oxidase subunit IV [Sphingomonas alba]|uniref:Aa3-type cytochrome c oxidase subunit IV n=1 Tax=Sphingomonas alba TaxID=2908208 RepID=A0ABT0RIA9_9SPHN|nr:aa3-type cytochrome c oxidase subunit IV [Sphingomonas alba]MCL6682351.1 aa3-type cytochrome c oxidase subunit IV [Sphingomonas alba]